MSHFSVTHPFSFFFFLQLNKINSNALAVPDYTTYNTSTGRHILGTGKD